MYVWYVLGSLACLMLVYALLDGARIYRSERNG